MALPLSPPLLPQLARPAKKLPTGDGWVYEPKWDGFRALAFVDGADVYLQSRSGKPLRRYFPELTFPDGRYVLDGEIVLFDADGRQDFDALGQRIHPAESRINMLAEQTPTRFIAFDLLAFDDESLLELPQRERRDRLEAMIAKPLDLTPCTESPDEAQPWLQGAEGVIAKRQDAPYKPGERVGMSKIKRVRTIDAVVDGLAPGQGGGHRRLPDPRPARRGRQAPRRRPHLRLQGRREARAPRQARPLRDRRARHGRPVALEQRARARVDRHAPRARRRGHLRPHLQRPHPPRHQDPPLARRQEAVGVLDGAADKEV